MSKCPTCGGNIPDSWRRKDTVASSRLRAQLRGQDIIDPTPALPEPLENAGKPVIVKDIND